MANRKPSNGFKKGYKSPTQFKKGHPCVNPKSVISRLEDAGFTKDMINQKISESLLANRDTTNEKKLDKDTSNFELIVISLIEAAIRNADSGRLDNLLEKIFGKTIRVEGNISLDSNNTNLNIDTADAEIMTRAIERAVKNTIKS